MASNSEHPQHGAAPKKLSKQHRRNTATTGARSHCGTRASTATSSPSRPQMRG